MTLLPNQLCDLRHLSSSRLSSLPPLPSPSPSFTLAEAAKVPACFCPSWHLLSTLGLPGGTNQGH